MDYIDLKTDTRLIEEVILEEILNEDMFVLRKLLTQKALKTAIEYRHDMWECSKKMITRKDKYKCKIKFLSKIINNLNIAIQGLKKKKRSAMGTINKLQRQVDKDIDRKNFYNKKLSKEI